MKDNLHKTEWSFKEFAVMNGYKPASVRKLIERGKLPAEYEVVEYSSQKKAIRLKPAFASRVKQEAEPAPEAQYTDEEKQIGYTRLRILQLWQQFRADADKAKDADFTFCYNYNELTSWPELKLYVDSIAIKTLYRWNDAYKLSGLAGIMPAWNLSRSTTITDVEKELLLKYYLKPNKPRIEECIRFASAEMETLGIEPKSGRTYRRFIERYTEINYPKVLLSREGYKSFNDKTIPDVQRDLSLIEAGDCVVMDGHVLDFEILNPVTGRQQRMMMVMASDMRSGMPLGWEIMPTENTWAVANALRRAIMTLGFKPRVVYLDNGRAFRSNAFSGGKKTHNKSGEIYLSADETRVTGAIERLGIKVSFAQPYHGQSKPIEKDFRIFAELERTMLTYVGNTIANKPARMHRNEKMHKQAYNAQIEAGGVITLEFAHERISAFFADMINREIKTGQFAGVTRYQNFADSLRRVFAQPDYPQRVVSLHELNDLMMAEEIRTLHKNGINFLNNTYWNNEFFNLKKGLRLKIRYDIFDRERVLIYDLKGAFMFEAQARERVHPMARLLGTDEQLKQLQDAIAERKELVKPVVKAVKTMLNKGADLDETKRVMAAKSSGKLAEAPEPQKPAIDPYEVLERMRLTPEEEIQLRERSRKYAV
ncbi:MAG: Mu transposase C-terminal domain-containing protein [Ignavibacteriaceae bacterium]|nr:Mu transposase C-terminal domain-containing protein [Ignavibacteriaceae bacterium]